MPERTFWYCQRSATASGSAERAVTGRRPPTVRRSSDSASNVVIPRMNVTFSAPIAAQTSHQQRRNANMQWKFPDFGQWQWTNNVPSMRTGAVVLMEIIILQTISGINSFHNHDHHTGTAEWLPVKHASVTALIDVQSGSFTSATS